MEIFNKMHAELLKKELSSILKNSKVPEIFKKKNKSYLNAICDKIIGKQIFAGGDIMFYILENSKVKTRKVLEKYCFNGDINYDNVFLAIIEKPYEKIEQLDN